MKRALGLVGGLFVAWLLLGGSVQQVVNSVAVGGITGLGTGIATALGINVGSAGAPITFNGAGGTPSSIALANGTGLPISTGVSGLGTGVATALGTAVGSASGPVTNGGALGTPSSGTLTNATGLPVAGLSNLGTSVATILTSATGSGGPPAYTTGTWTPAITTSGTVGTPAYTTQIGSYEKVGRQVTARFNLVLSGWTGSPTGSVSLSGLPATSTTVTGDDGHCLITSYSVSALAALSYGVTGLIIANDTKAFLLENGSAAAANISAAQAGTTPTFIGACFYRTD